MNKMKKFLAGLLALVMIISLVPMSALAAEECDHANAYYIDSWDVWRCDECSTWHSEDPRPVEEPEEEPAEECTHANAVYVEPWDMWHCDDCSSWFEEDPRAAEEPAEPEIPEEPVVPEEPEVEEPETEEPCTHPNLVVDPFGDGGPSYCDDCHTWVTVEEETEEPEEPAEKPETEEPCTHPNLVVDPFGDGGPSYCDDCHTWVTVEEETEEPEEPAEEPEETECEHDFTWKLVATTTVAKEGDCEHATEYYYSCKKCEALDLEHTFTVSLPAGHQWDEGEVSKEVTCLEDGEMTYTCQREGCGETKTEPIAHTGHVPGEPVHVVERKATCTEDGYEYDALYCTVCENLLNISNKTYPEALDHDWDEGEVSKEVTCLEDGEMTYTCQREDCGETKTAPITAPGQHTPGEPTMLVEREATCTEEGKQREVTSCTVCKQVINMGRWEYPEALDHDWDEGEVSKEVTCLEDGEMTYTCKRGCGHTVTEDVEIDPENHTGETVTKNESETYSGDIHCGSCDALLEEGKVIAVPSTPITPAKPTWKNWLDKVINNWKDKIECPEEPTEPEETIPEETVPEETEPEETEPEETVPAAPVTPAKPNWGSIIRGCWNWIFR